jgi:EmrB/QacA subfamily drug resistance transporter
MSEKTTRQAALTIASLSSFITPFMISSINIGLPAIEQEFQTDAILLSWVATSYLLAAAVFLVPAGKLADLYGRKKMFLIGMGVFTVTAFFSAVAVSAHMLIVFRIFQGAGSAMVFATGIAILSSVFPAQQRGRVLGIAVAAVYVGLSCGPLFGGWLTHHFSWRSIFWSVLPVGGLVILLVLTRLKGEWTGEQGGRFDFIGALFYGAAIVVLMYGISLIPDPASAWMIGAGAAGLVIFVIWETRVADPVFEVRLFLDNRVFAFSCLAALIHYSATFAVTFLLSLFLQYIKGMSPQGAGLVLIASPVMMAAFSPLAGRLSDRIEPRLIASVGMGLTGLGLILLVFVSEATPLRFIVASLMLLGFGFAFFSSPNMNAIMGAVEKRHYGIASGAVGTMRLLGQMFSMGIATLVFAILIGRVQITPSAYPALVKSVHLALLIFAGLCGLGVFFSLSRGKVRR